MGLSTTSVQSPFHRRAAGSCPRAAGRGVVSSPGPLNCPHRLQLSDNIPFCTQYLSGNWACLLCSSPWLSWLITKYIKTCYSLMQSFTCKILPSFQSFLISHRTSKCSGHSRITSMVELKFPRKKYLFFMLFVVGMSVK